VLRTALGRIGATHLLMLSAVLSGVGLVAVLSATAGLSASRGIDWGGEPAGFALRHLRGLALGVVAAVVIAAAPGGLVQKSGYAAWLFGVALLAATHTPLGLAENGAKRWLDLGFVVVQPLEVAKLGLVLGLAQWLSAHAHRMVDVRYSLAVPACMIALPAGVALSHPSFSGAALLVAFGAVLVFLAGARLSHLVVVGVAACTVLAWAATAADYREARIAAFLDPFGDATGGGYQLVHSLYAFGLGGLFGRGLGGGVQKQSFLPEPHTDFILAVIGEELGLVGVCLLMVAFAAMGLASLGIASRARDMHGMLLAAGAGCLLWLQAGLNAGVTLGLLPTTGLTLPLISYGRSSLVTSLIAIGLVLHVARLRSEDARGEVYA
jgi:cell division protein FtsW